MLIELERTAGNLSVRLVTDEELGDVEFIRDVKSFATKLRIPRRRFVDWLVDGVRDSETRLVDGSGNPVGIDFEAIETDQIELWLKTWMRMPERHSVPRLRIEARERVRVIATLLRMIFPKESSVWGAAVEAQRLLPSG